MDKAGDGMGVFVDAAAFEALVRAPVARNRDPVEAREEGHVSDIGEASVSIG